MLLKYLVAMGLEHSFVFMERIKIAQMKDVNIGFEKTFSKALCEVFQSVAPMKDFIGLYVEML